MLIHSITSSFAYKYIERCFVQSISFAVSIILARILNPEDFGVLSLMMIFISLANIFIYGGFCQALVQAKDATDEDFSSVFWLMLFVASGAYTILFFSAPYIADFYGLPSITPTFRVLGIILFFASTSSIQLSRLARAMNFKLQMQANMASALISAFVGITMAYNNAGLWSLVVQQLVQRISLNCILLVIVDWHPQFIFSHKRVKKHFSFGWKILIVNLLNTLYANLNTFIIGKIYSPTALAIYNRGQSFPNLIIDNINSSIQTVLLPALASHQDNQQKVKMLMRRSIMTSSCIIFPLMMGLALIAEPLVLLLLTKKWLPVVPYLQVYCFTKAFLPIQSANLQAIKALGRSDIFMKLEIIKKLFALTILFFTVYIYNTPIAIAVATALSSILFSFIDAFPNKKLLSYSYTEQLKDVFPSFLLSIMMAVIIYPISLLDFNIYITMFLQIFIGIVTYTLLAYIFKVDAFIFILNKILSVLRCRKIIK